MNKLFSHYERVINHQAFRNTLNEQAVLSLREEIAKT